MRFCTLAGGEALHGGDDDGRRVEAVDRKFERERLMEGRAVGATYYVCALRLLRFVLQHERHLHVEVACRSTKKKQHMECTRTGVGDQRMRCPVIGNRRFLDK